MKLTVYLGDTVDADIIQFIKENFGTNPESLRHMLRQCAAWSGVMVRLDQIEKRLESIHPTTATTLFEAKPVKNKSAIDSMLGAYDDGD